MKRVLIITMNKYPEGDAGSIRQHSFAKIFQHLGYNVFVIGYGSDDDGTVHSYQGIEYISARGKSNSRFIRFLNRYFFVSKVKTYLKSQKEHIDVIFVVDVLPNCFRYIKKYAQREKVTLIHDSVEWYSPEEFKRGKHSFEYRLKEYTNTKAIDCNWKVVAISSYLNHYFISKNIESIRIPVIMNIKDEELSSNVNLDYVRFVYAGGPGLKDNLKEMIKGFACLARENLNKLKFYIIGVTKEQLIANCKVEKKDIEKMGDSLIVLGRVERRIAKEYVKQSDFSVLLRNPNLRYAKAGFPTKYVESLSVGTPTLCNLTSDINLYAIDEENGIVVDDFSPEAFAKSIIRALSISNFQKKEMRIKARETAIQHFDYRNYYDAFSSLLGKDQMV